MGRRRTRANPPAVTSDLPVYRSGATATTTARPGWFDIRDYGAVGGVDCTAAFVAALAAAAAATRYGVVYVPAGDWLLHEVDWANGPTIMGDEVGSSRLVYNGVGGPGTYIFRNPVTTGSTPYTGFRNLTLLGWASGVSPGVCQTAYTSTSGAATDWGFKLENVHAAAFGGDAFVLGPAVNVHANRLRFDAILGYCIKINHTPAGDGPRPVTLNQWTLDNASNTAFRSAATASGFDPTTACLGVLRIVDAAGINFVSSDGRIEINYPMKPETDGRLSLFRIETPGTASAIATFVRTGLNNVENCDGVVFCYAPNGHVAIDFANSAIPFTKLFEGATPEYDLFPGAAYAPMASSRFNAQQAQGVFVNALQIEARPAVPSSTVFNLYRRGDLILRTNPVPGSTGAGWIASGPTTGVGRPSMSALNGTVAIASGSQTVSLETGAELCDLPVGLNVSIAGAGASGAALLCQVTAQQIAARTVTVDTAAETTVAGAELTSTAPAWSEFGDLASYGTAAPTTGSWGRGEKRWNTAPSAGGAVGWICVVAGTPGTWNAFGVIAD